MELYWFIFFRTISFYFELFATTILFFIHIERTKNFLIKFILGFVGGVGFCFLFALVNYLYLKDNHEVNITSLVLSIFSYFLLFSYNFIYLRLIYKTNLYHVSFYATAGYTTKQFIFTLYLFILNFIDRGLIVFNYGGTNAINILIYLGIFLTLIITIYFLLIRKMNIIRKEDSFGVSSLILFLSAVFIFNILNAIMEQSSTNLETLDVMYLSALFGQLIGLAIIIVTQNFVLDKMRANNENKLIKEILLEKEKEYKFAEATAELISIKAHDLKHQVAALRAGGEDAKKVLDEIDSVVQSYEHIIKTGNAVIDVILSEKWLYCDKNNIKLSCIVDPNSLNMLSKSDLYTLLGNLLDNAIEAVSKIENVNRRVITFNVFEKSGMAFIITNNYYDGVIKFGADKMPYTSKEDKSNHGYGTKSIKMILDRYKGNVKFNVNNDIFIVNIMIPITN